MKPRRTSMPNFPLRPPGAPLRSSVIRAVIACFILLLGLTPVVAAWTMSGADYIRRSVTFFAAAAVLIVGLAGAHHPFPRFGVANTVTLVRVALVAALAGLLGETPDPRMASLAIAIVIIVAALDGVDGWLARRGAQSSAFGARFDMETDAALILILSALVWQHGKAGAWVLACGLMRYGFVAAGWVLPWMAGPLRSTMRGKSVAIGQFIGLAVALSPIVPVRVSNAVAAVTLLVLAWSFAVDIAWLKRQGAARTRSA
jgi:phosphatidylglycerophosphate synthase